MGRLSPVGLWNPRVGILGVLNHPSLPHHVAPRRLEVVHQPLPLELLRHLGTPEAVVVPRVLEKFLRGVAAHPLVVGPWGSPPIVSLWGIPQPSGCLHPRSGCHEALELPTEVGHYRLRCPPYALE